MPNRQLWVNRYTGSWQGWTSSGGGLFTSASACVNTKLSQPLRIGGTGTDGQCWVLTSQNGSTFTPQALGSPCP